MCSFSLNALRFCAQGRVVLCRDDKTGMQRRPRPYPPLPRPPGTPAKREHEYIRHGGRAWIASCVVATGQGVGNLGQTRTRADCAVHLAHGVHPLPEMQRSDWVGDKLKTHGSLAVCRLVAQWGHGPWVAKDLHCGGQRRAFLSAPSHTPGFHLPPKQGSWLNQVAWWLSVLARRFLQRGDCCSAQDFETRLDASLAVYNTHHAHPYRWTSTGQPLVRATPFSQTRRPQRHGRAWLSARPKRFERVFYPPRPYKRAAA